MRKIDIREPNEDWWRDWLEKCDDATDDLIRNVELGNEVKIDERLYKENKYSFFFSEDGPFKGKCAYCECDVTRQHGDVEHYRPKKAVTDEKDKPVISGEDHSERHPGYYWLAYKWKNLLPSCQICNVGNKQKSVGKSPGKRNRFPIEDERTRGWRPGEENQESELLINPMWTDPSDHIEFNPNGIITNISDKGLKTIEILGLNDYSLPAKRSQRYKEVKTKAKNCIRDHRLKVENGSNEIDIENIKKGIGEYTSFALLAISDAIIEERQRLEDAIAELSSQ